MRFSAFILRRRSTMHGAIVSLLVLVAACANPPAPRVDASATTVSDNRPPNIVLILTDDLGIGELGCYGQTIIKTPNIDRLAAAGTRFTEAYSGSCVCAPSRCTLLTGYHTGHAAIRDNKELKPEGQEPLPADTVTIAQLLKSKGYATAAIGKWGLGPPGSTGDPAKHGFDHFFGYLCQRHAHNYCPSYLYRNDQRIPLPGNQDRWPDGDILGPGYSPDLFREEAEEFIAKNRQRPFFLLYATPVPHAALQVPEDSLAEYRGRIDDAPYDGSKGYLKHSAPHAAYAAMVSRMDRDVGLLVDRLEREGLADDTLVVFTSDNGPTFNGGTDSAFFASASGRRGLKCQLYEGGIRVPLIFKWPNRVRDGAVSGAVTGNWDLFATFAAIGGIERAALPRDTDAIDLAPQLFADRPVAQREHLYWEYAAGGGWQAVRLGRYKGVRRNAKKAPDGPIEVYDLEVDPNETTNVATAHREITDRIAGIMASRTKSPIPEWNFGP